MLKYKKMIAKHISNKRARIVVSCLEPRLSRLLTVSYEKKSTMPEPKQSIQTFSNPVNQMPYFQIRPIKRPVKSNDISTCLM